MHGRARLFGGGRLRAARVVDHVEGVERAVPAFLLRQAHGERAGRFAPQHLRAARGLLARAEAGPPAVDKFRRHGGGARLAVHQAGQAVLLGQLARHQLLRAVAPCFRVPPEQLQPVGGAPQAGGGAVGAPAFKIRRLQPFICKAVPRFRHNRARKIARQNAPAVVLRRGLLQHQGAAALFPAEIALCQAVGAGDLLPVFGPFFPAGLAALPAEPGAQHAAEYLAALRRTVIRGHAHRADPRQIAGPALPGFFLLFHPEASPSVRRGSSARRLFCQTMRLS